MQQFFMAACILSIAMPVFADTESLPANAVLREQWVCDEPAYWRVDRAKTESPQVVRVLLAKEPTCRMMAQDVFAVGELVAEPVEMILPLSATTVDETGYGVNLYLPIQFDTTAPVH